MPAKSGAARATLLTRARAAAVARSARFMAALPEGPDDVLVDEIDLRRILGDRPQHEVLEPRLREILDAGSDVVGCADHVTLLKVLVGAMRSHRSEEGCLRAGQGSRVAPL